MLNLRRQPLSRCNTHSLPIKQERHDQQREYAQKHAEDTERQGRSSLSHPSSNEERPGETDDSAKGGDSNEAVPRNCVVRVEKLWAKEVRALQYN